MPVGIDTDFFKPEPSIKRESKLILVLGRISPVKHIDLIIKGFENAAVNDSTVRLRIVGDAMPRDAAYAEEVRDLISNSPLSNRIEWLPAVSNAETLKQYREANIVVNATTSGSFDKTMFEAMSSGALLVTSNEALKDAVDRRLTFKEGDEKSLADALAYALGLNSGERDRLSNSMREYVMGNHSLSLLMPKLAEEFNSLKSGSFLSRYRWIRYIFSGGMGAFTQLFLLFLFTSVFHIWYLISGVIAFLASVVVGFLFQKMWTFKDYSNDRTKRAFIGYLVIALFNLGANTLLLYEFTDKAHIPYLISQMIASVFTAIWSFFLYRKFLFKR